MTEHVFKPVRIRQGKRVQSPLFCGRYSLGRGEKVRTVALHTPDITVARKRLRTLIVEKQQERDGIIPPESVRNASALAVSVLIGRYGDALRGLGRNPRHVKGTAARLLRMAREMHWKRLADIRPDTFAAWLAKLTLAAKSKKEYQVSAVAFLNWLVRTEQLPRNPLARLENVEIRGAEVRPSRSLRADEIERLLSTSGPRRLVYLAMLYTGMRRGEVKKLRWCDIVNLETARPYVLLRIETTKGKKSRPIPLHPVLASALLEVVERESNDLVFAPFPRWEAMRADFKNAGIEHRDQLGRVAHFHSFRKSFQTLGVNAGVNQRSAQALLGHSDPSLTAGVYTDVAALELHGEVGKLPWFGQKSGDAVDSLIDPKTPQKRDFRAVLSELIQMAEAAIKSQDAKSETAVSVFSNGARDRTRTCTPFDMGF